jgi:energy-coupling factor transporter ATP-binding protein EcfA2
MTDTLSPRWIRDLERLLPIRSQFIIAGNIRDHFLVALDPENPTPVPLTRCLWFALQRQGYRFLLIYDPVEGVRPYPNEPEVVNLASRLFNLKLQDGVMPMSLESLSDLMKRLSRLRDAHVALLLDFASRLVRYPDHMDQCEHRFFLAAERLAVHAMPVVVKGGTDGQGGGKPRFNPVLWLLNRPQDLPSWFVLDNAKVETLHVTLPDFETRQAAARSYIGLFAQVDNASLEAREKFARDFASATEGLPLLALSDTAQLANRQGIAFQDVDDAVRSYKVGDLENPWKKTHLRQRIAEAATFIEGRVKGQEQAVTKTVDILMRSVMGLTGAQTKSGSNRPRGVLFLAGPTGTGKTELAKTLTQLVFGNERSYIRFDMSEFAEEHSGARLLGAPPGYVGFEAGGELTNAVREKPFSVVLFDEVEKAHPRILDKFLQILEDGRLTDGRGDTAYFSETILVFTTNLGIYVEDEAGHRIQSVQPGDSYEIVEARVRGAIAEHFKFHLSRPELLNRIGDNIVVFNFISPSVAKRIFTGMLNNVIARVWEEHRLELELAPEVYSKLMEWCTHDLSNGGRGIGNQLESRFINPLARALFAFDLEGRKSVSVAELTISEEKIVSVRLE